MGVLRNVYRSHLHEEFIQSLVSPESANLPAAFGTIRELMCFAAVLGYEMERYEPLDRAQGVEDIGINVFENNNSDDLIYTLAVAHTGSTDVLKSSSEVDMVEIFEGYANAGLTLLKSWSTQYRSQRGFQSIIQGLFDNNFIAEDTVDREKLINAVSF